MKVKKMVVGGVLQKVLIVDEDDVPGKCENCAKPFYNHPMLAKEDDEWCINCCDAHHRPGWNELQIGQWSMEQIANGKIICVVMRT
tara:strand:- start:2175 stop:2432 length:258 start_codon:yes stop_codon:yes gene_type:complete